MDAITRAINEAVAAKLWLPALALALAVPDICSQLEYPNLAGPGSTGKRYPLWFDAWVKERLFRFGHAGKEFPMTGEDCYAFRNAFLHVGESELQGKHKANYKLVVPTAGNLGHMSTEEALGQSTVLYVGAEPFCLAMIEGASCWTQDILVRRPEVQADLNRLLNIVDGEVTVSYEVQVGDWVVQSTSTMR